MEVVTTSPYYYYQGYSSSTPTMEDFQENLLILTFASLTICDPSFDFNYPNVKGDMYDVPVNLMAPKKNPHSKGEKEEPVTTKPDTDWSPYDFSKFESYLNTQLDGGKENNRIKRRTKKRHHAKLRSKGHDTGNSSTIAPNARRQSSGDYRDTQQKRGKKYKKGQYPAGYDTYNPQGKRADFVEMPKDLYQAHLRPGVIFRIHMAEAIIKMQYRSYEDDKDESVIEADVEYLRLTRKVINDEITKFEDLKWLIGWFNNRSDLIKEHTCNTKYFAVGIPPTAFTHSEEYMKRMCLFDNVYIDHIPYVVGEDSSLMAAVAPPVLHCDAATCTSVPFVDSIMFDDRLSRTNVRTVTRCQAGCRAHCKNDADCLKRCSDRCLRT